jgi:hypothetical protein
MNLKPMLTVMSLFTCFQSAMQEYDGTLHLLWQVCGRGNNPNRSHQSSSSRGSHRARDRKDLHIKSASSAFGIHLNGEALLKRQV